MSAVGGGEDDGALFADGAGPAVVDIGRLESEPGMAVMVVIPSDEGSAVGPSSLDGLEPEREVGPLLQCLEPRFGMGGCRRRLAGGCWPW